MTQTVGVVGLGLVGIELARHLLTRGYGVIGFDVDAARLDLLRASGGEAARSPREVAERASQIVLALFDTPTTVRVVEGPDGLMAAARPPVWLIDTSTGDPDEVVALGERLAAHGTRLVDATLSGSSAQIAARTAIVMVGARAEDHAACRDLLEAIGDRIFHLGGPGAGMKAKLASNVIVGLNRVALAEGLACARALGLDLSAFLAMAKASPAYSAAMDAKGARMVEGRYASPESRVRQHRKDLATILQYASAAGQRLPLTAAHLELLDEAVAAGDGELDNAAVFRRYA